MALHQMKGRMIKLVVAEFRQLQDCLFSTSVPTASTWLLTCHGIIFLAVAVSSLMLSKPQGMSLR